MPEDVVFDPAKNARNILKHGLALASFDGFDELTHVEVDTRFDYGEVRYRAFGRINGLGYAIAFTYQGPLTRLISFRRAHEKEMRRYE